MIKIYVSIALSFLIISNSANAQFGGLLNQLKDQVTDAIKPGSTPPKESAPQQLNTQTPPPIANESSSNNASSKNITLVKNQYPEDIQGSFTFSDGDLKKNCESNIVFRISKSERLDETDSSCTPTSVTESNGKYVIKETCTREGRKNVGTIQLASQGGNLQFTEGNNTYIYKRCPPSSSQASTPSNSIQKCTVNQGQAGVTTFLDEKLKKTGTSMRYFDGYEFQAEKTITVGKDKVLVGKLYDPALSKYTEQKSYAYAEEWTCK
jgi:hypothetical protein